MMIQEERALSKSSEPNSTSVNVSVVVVSHNEGDNLRKTVHSLLATLPSDGEIIVVDDCSADGSADFIDDRYAGVTLLNPAERLGAASARNYGGRQARGEIIIFSDAHMEVPF